MDDIAIEARCPACGAVVFPDARSRGLCPACILELALESPSLMAELEADEAGVSFGNADLGGSISIADDEASTLAYPREAFAEGQVLGGRYRIRALLGRGGMGEVWRATDLKLRVDVALKALHRQLLDDSRALETLRDEVRLAREVVSPNVCRVFDLVELDGQELVSMEYIDGITLLHILKARAPLDLSEAREIAAQFLAGLEAIHAAGLVHRDVKPENLMMTRSGRVVLMDFGIAKGLQEGVSATIAGTPAYMSPEQSRGEELDARADVFSAGVVLAEMIDLGGIKTPDARQRIWKRIRQEPPEVGKTPWAAVLKRSLAAAKEQRYPTASALARALEEVTLRAGGDEDLDPYPGLASFTEEEAEYFFGRELEIEEMWKKLHRPHLLALIGPSGAGKSSFLRAGLLSVIPTGWRALVVTPGSQPFSTLARSLVPELAGDTEALQLLTTPDDEDALVQAVLHWRRQHDQALLILDQFEELFTQNPPEIQERFASLLSRLALEADIHVLLSMRDDFLFHCTGQESLAPIYSELTPLKPLSGTALRRALVQPALKCGYRFEDDTLVDEMVAEVADERGALPLLAFAAARLWSLRDREQGLLTREAYEHIGGVGGALAQHAEQTLEKIGHDQIPTVREIFRNLVTAQGTRLARSRDELLSVFSAAQEAPVFRSAARESAGDAKTGARGRPDHSGQALDHPSRHSDGTRAGQGSGTRLRKQSRPETLDHNRLPHDAAMVLDALIDARLLTAYEEPATDDDGEPQQRIEIIHESLLSNWPRLVRWRTQDADSAQLKDQLRQAAQMWIERGRPEDLLWTGTSYKEYELRRERYEGGLSESEETFADAMKIKSERQKRRRRLAVAAAFALLIAILAVVGVSRQQAVRAARQAKASELVALGRAELGSDPTRALAFSLASLETIDSQQARTLVLQALWSGPPKRVLMPPEVADYFWLDISRDSRWIALSGHGPNVYVWSRQGGSPATLQGQESFGHNVGFSPSGEILAARSPNLIRRWQAPDWREIDPHPSRPELWASLSGDRIFAVHPAMDDSEDSVEMEAWSFEGTLLAGPERWQRSRTPGPNIIDPSGEWIAYLKGKNLLLRDLEGLIPGAERLIGNHSEPIVAFTTHASGTRIASRDETGELRVWNPRDSSVMPIWTFRGEPQPLAEISVVEGLALDDSGSRLAARRNRTVGVWDLDRPRRSQYLELRSTDSLQVHGLQFEPSGQWLAVNNHDSVILWPLPEVYPTVVPGDIVAVVFDPSGRWLATGSKDEGIRIWPLGKNLEEGSLLYSPPDGSEFNCSLAVTPDGESLLAGVLGQGVLVVPVDGSPPRRLPGPKRKLRGHRSIAVSKDGRWIASGAGGSEEGVVIPVWDLASGELVKVLDPQADPHGDL
ncbi:MAG: protein kinase, partial [Acidobacteriota bacterium]